MTERRHRPRAARVPRSLLRGVQRRPVRRQLREHPVDRSRARTAPPHDDDGERDRFCELELCDLAYTRTEVPVLDGAGAAHYAQLTRSAVAAYGGRFRVLAAEAHVAEGEWAPEKRVVLIEFPDMEHTRRWYESAEYAPAREIAASALERTLVFVEGFDEPQEADALAPGDPEATVRRFYDAMGSGDTSSVREFLADGWEDIPLPPGVPAGIDGFTATVAFLRTAFPDLSITVEDVLVAGDRVATRVVARGTHHGEFLGVPPTGRPVEFRAFDVHRLSNGEIAQSWHIEDLFAVLQQLQA